MHQKVRKAIIPAAGFGTRMLPATKSVPKELLPIVDRPILDYIVAEAFASGIEHVAIVTGRMKGAIEDYFDHAFEVDVSLRNAGKHGLADRMAQYTPVTGSISFVRQQQARGLGHAVWTARQIVGDEPFAVLLPDMLMVADEPCLKSMMDLHARHGGNVVAVERCAPEETHKFGIVSLQSTGGDPHVVGLVEKPAPGEAPSNLFISGRYILQPEIFDLLESQSPGAGGEIQLTDAMIALMSKQMIRPFEFRGRTFDCGAPAGFVSANLHMALARADLGAHVNLEIETLAAARSAVA
ncbi:UTP--glucose-1-phosphate uridylyltransferase [Rhizobium mesoamericanum]|uniref:UTP--glucose-1-phosphate uridylyltransferase n=1 Tax=Rhizobium mesoamericanum TaxID=1079800 RepID=UPI0027837813|nr:UTP--glucose-1-phosphate uridylyltransferase [Rhizobium mesoamericanum]MDQ0560083.1 UTP--glucose-1-phosphate uridylyltransferase [Rhizobium mesoamericanum]